MANNQIDMPSMATAMHQHTTYSANDLGSAVGIGAAMVPREVPMVPREVPISARELLALNRAFGETTVTRRLVQVIITDPNENVPLDQCILHMGETKVTDATDQELYFELDIKKLLDEHNVKRTKIIDKKVKDRTEYLEPARVRDLKMVVVKIADL